MGSLGCVGVLKCGGVEIINFPDALNSVGMLSYKDIADIFPFLKVIFLFLTKFLLY